MDYNNELHGVGALGLVLTTYHQHHFLTAYDVDGYSNIQYHTPADLLPLRYSSKSWLRAKHERTTMLSAKESESTLTEAKEEI